MSQQLSVGDDSLGSWSNLSFEDEHPDDNSSFLHLSDRYTSTNSLMVEGLTDVTDTHAQGFLLYIFYTYVDVSQQND